MGLLSTTDMGLTPRDGYPSRTPKREVPCVSCEPTLGQFPMSYHKCFEPWQHRSDKCLKFPGAGAMRTAPTWMLWFGFGCSKPVL